MRSKFQVCFSNPLKNAVVASFNLAKRRAKLVAARTTATFVAVLVSHPSDRAACRLYQQAASCVGIVLAIVPTIGANERPEMPNWPVGGSTYSVASANDTTHSPTNVSPLPVNTATQAPVASPPKPSNVANRRVVHAPGSEEAMNSKAGDERRLARSRKQPNESGSDHAPGVSRSMPRFGLPAGSVYTTVTALTVVLGLFMLFVWGLRRGSQRATTVLPAEIVSVVGRVRLTPRQHAELLKVGNKLVLVALTSGGADPITEISEPSEVNRLLGLCQRFDRHSPSKAFEDVFREMSHESAPNKLFGQESLLAAATPIADAYRAHRREGGRA